MFKYARIPLAILMMAGTASLASAQTAPKGQPNSKKYSNAGVKPATGRSGSATLEARALLSKGGALQIEASTGSLEDGTSVGNIDKVQLKAFANGTAAVSNFNNLTGGGYWTGTFAGISRGERVQLQTNISGVDPKRTGVVTVTANAALRPDIAVMSVDGPAQVTPQSNVNFLATVSEKNGDVGARTNCVLSIDGTEVDSASSIWVDAAGTVTCAFDHLFAAPGTYAVKVTAAGVNPGDFDLANNSAESTITVVEPGRQFQGGTMGAELYDRLETYSGVSTSGPSYNYTQVYRHNYSHAYFQGWVTANAAALQRVDASLYADGALQHSISLTPNNGSDYNDGTWFNHCRNFDNWTAVYTGNGYEHTSSGDWTQMCTSGEVGDPAAAYTWAYYQRATGRITYFAQGHDSYHGNTWYSNDGYTYGTGAANNWLAGTQVRLKLSFVDQANQALTVDETVVLEDHSSQINSSNSGYWYDNYIGRTIQYQNVSTGRFFRAWKNW